jgi:hypothetical protein
MLGAMTQGLALLTAAPRLPGEPRLLAPSDNRLLIRSIRPLGWSYIPVSGVSPYWLTAVIWNAEICCSPPDHTGSRPGGVVGACRIPDRFHSGANDCCVAP